MLHKAFQRFQLSRDRNAKEPSPSIASLDPITTVDLDAEAPPFFSLSIDILSIILEYLTFRDLVAISLTAKALRHLCPPVTRSSETRAEGRCRHRLNRRLIPAPRTQSQGTQNGSPHKCPYCSHPLCPPTCSSALFLDSSTGVFYPSNLYPVATFKYSKSPPIDSSQPFVYSTIWCAHHRCPRDLLTQKPPLLKSISSQIQYSQIQFGPQRFLAEYNHPTLFNSQNKKPYYLCFQTPSWLAGYKPEYELPTRLIRTRRGADITSDEKLVGVKRYGYLDEITKEQVDEEGNKTIINGWLQPSYERFHYEMLCMHCFLPLNLPTRSIWTVQFPHFCRCHYDILLRSPTTAPRAESSTTAAQRTFPNRRPGCRMCGFASVKYTLVEAFDIFRVKTAKKQYGLRQEYFRLFLATECDIISDMSPYAVEKERLRPRDPAHAALSLEIVRGFPPDAQIIPFTPPPKIGIINLPYPVLRMILRLLLEEAESVHAYYQALQSSYVFLKAYYRSQVTRTTLEKLQERYTYSRGVSWPAPFPPDPRQVG
ncbi:hypothetical protein AA313_de0200305 [Arthrobotrys entomopaga]|nr:hypothetical protein AA313_de0200305 [Arthrobotrys entomopaga]